MSSFKILFSNLGYARGISGALIHHLRYAHRHLYCPPDTQKASLKQLGELIRVEDPDLGCFVEIDQGSFSSGGYNQLEMLINQRYSYFDIENKYGEVSYLRSFFMTKGKSNAFVAKQPWPYEKLFFRHGSKRLVYKIILAQNLTLFFSHFSLSRQVRHRQLHEASSLMKTTKGESVFLGDFNILTGPQELAPLLENGFVLLNQQQEHTFTFHKRRLMLDLCLCSPAIAGNTFMKIIPQPYSDHAALLLEIKT